MLIKRAESKFLTASDVDNRENKRVTIITEVKEHYDEGFDKTCYRCKVEMSDGAKKLWTINNSSRNSLLDLFGEESIGWVDKQVKLGTKDIPNGKKMIFIDEKEKLEQKEKKKQEKKD